MKAPIVQGIIDRRILLNFAVDPQVLQTHIPAPFTPLCYNGKAIAGICLIRLKQLRPKGLPAFTGFTSENGAHRFAVTWKEQGIERQGVYIPRRDTSSRWNAWVGGRLFPGLHYHARFEVQEQGGCYEVGFQSSDQTVVRISAQETTQFNPDSVFENFEAVSAFFEKGSMGFSPNKDKQEGLFLKTYTWKMAPLKVNKVESSFFDNPAYFPPGTIQFDNALLMTHIEHEWQPLSNQPDNNTPVK